MRTFIASPRLRSAPLYVVMLEVRHFLESFFNRQSPWQATPERP